MDGPQNLCLNCYVKVTTGRTITKVVDYSKIRIKPNRSISCYCEICRITSSSINPVNDTGIQQKVTGRPSKNLKSSTLRICSSYHSSIQQRKCHKCNRESRILNFINFSGNDREAVASEIVQNNVFELKNLKGEHPTYLQKLNRNEKTDKKITAGDLIEI